jgi:hypothetical protein
MPGWSGRRWWWSAITQWSAWTLVRWDLLALQTALKSSKVPVGFCPSPVIERPSTHLVPSSSLPIPYYVTVSITPNRIASASVRDNAPCLCATTHCSTLSRMRAGAVSRINLILNRAPMDDDNCAITTPIFACAGVRCILVMELRAAQATLARPPFLLAVAPARSQCLRL